MKRLYLLILLLLPVAGVRSQNLVPNSGFEEYSAIPTSFAQWYQCENWFNVNGITAIGSGAGSPDYLHSQAGSWEAWLPGSIFGFVNPHTGEAVMGVAMEFTENPNFREYISTQLIQPMLPGNEYTVTFWITNGLSDYYCGSGCNRLGIYLSANLPVQQLAEPMDLVPQLEIPGELWTNVWQQYTFTVVPTEAWNYLTIGQFAADSTTSRTLHHPTAVVPEACYYFLDDISVKEVPAGPIVSGDTHICAGESALLQATNSTSYAWTTEYDPGTVFSTDSIVIVMPSETTGYTVNGPVGETSFTVVVDPLPVFDLGSAADMCPGQPLIAGTDYYGAVYTWSTGEQDDTIYVAGEGMYTLELTLNGCSYTDSVYITVPDACYGRLAMPNVFSPNSDGANDLFLPLSGKLNSDMVLRIFNRWGNRVHEGFLQNGWDGTSNGKPCPEGVYFWQIVSYGEDFMHGNVTLCN